MIFDIDDSLVERAFDGSHVDCLLARCLGCDNDHRMSLSASSFIPSDKMSVI